MATTHQSDYFGDDGCTIVVAGLDKQIALRASQGFACAVEADAPMVRQFKIELLPFMREQRPQTSRSDESGDDPVTFGK